MEEFFSRVEHGSVGTEDADDGALIFIVSGGELSAQASGLEPVLQEIWKHLARIPMKNEDKMVIYAISRISKFHVWLDGRSFVGSRI